MRVCLVSLNRYRHDRRARTLARSLVAAGHEVVVVASGTHEDGAVDDVPVTYVPPRLPVGWGTVGKVLRRLQPLRVRTLLHRRRLARVARSTAADLFYPTTAACVPIASAAAGDASLVARQPQWQAAGRRDIVHLAPHRSTLSVSPSGPGLTLEVTETGALPAPGRHGGLRIALAYRKTDSNPGRYLEAAMRRAGITVDLHTTGIDWGALPANTDGVVFVEGPYPALRIEGRKPAVPTAMWVHHGEHHLFTNLRLVERYGADAVLLAHSWHLAHRFPVPVHRFPFGVPPELIDGSIPHDRRRYDAAMVGGQLHRRGGTYARRQQLVDDVEQALGPERVAFVSDVDAATMASIYGDARIVLNEGGTRHYPITMRVFEAVGAGAVLLTDDLPGTDVLFRRDEHYVVLEDDVATQITALLAAPDQLQQIAAAGRDHAMAAHTYDHRVDRLVAVLAGTSGTAGSDAGPESDPMAALIDADVEVQRITRIGAPELDEQLASREVWDVAQVFERLHPATMEAVAV
ncbi:MAG: glycosyltransferase, partial [Acidimicrobiia bacterium]